MKLIIKRLISIFFFVVKWMVIIIISIAIIYVCYMSAEYSIFKDVLVNN